MCKSFVIVFMAGAVLTFGAGCHNASRVAEVVRDSAFTGVGPIYGAAKDTVKRTSVLARVDSSDEEGGESELGADHYRLYVKDSCLMDSAIVIPKRYVSSYKLDSFVTHTFISRVRLEKNGETILDRVITKKDFTPLLDVSLRRYATIRCPNMSLKQDSIRLGYSISIPLTDVGQQKYAVIDRGGNLTFRESRADD